MLVINPSRALRVRVISRGYFAGLSRQTTLRTAGPVLASTCAPALIKIYDECTLSPAKFSHEFCAKIVYARARDTEIALFCAITVNRSPISAIHDIEIICIICHSELCG